MKKLLDVQRLNISVDDKPIVRNLSFSMEPGSFHVLMGPNGSGKSTLAYALLGHPRYAVTAEKILFAGKELSKLTTDKRARLGIFLGFQYPLVLSGVSLSTLMSEMMRPAKVRNSPSMDLSLASAMAREQREAADKVRAKTAELLPRLGLTEDILYRSLNDGFSGGEKKKAEIIQLFAAQPKLAILDEPDSGLDVDALKGIAHAINDAHKKGTAVLLITHYARVLRYLKPDRVHVMHRGHIVTSDGPDLANTIEEQGYDAFTKQAKRHAPARKR